MAARRGTAKVEAPVEVVEPVEVDAPEVESEEVNDADVPETGEDETTETPAEPEVKPENVVNIESFLAVLADGVEKSDKETGVLDVKSESDIMTAYRELANTKSKTAARKFVDEAMRDAVNESDINLARLYMSLSPKLLSAPAAAGAKAPAKPVDPTEHFVEQAVRLRLAMSILDQSKPEKLADDWKTQVTTKFDDLSTQLDTWATWLDSEDKTGEAPEVDTLVKAAFKTAEGKSATVSNRKPRAGSAPSDGVRRDIGKHMTEAFADQPVGAFLSIAQIRAYKSTEYGDITPSAGAISARLFPKDAAGTIKATTVPNLEGVDTPEGKGAKKTA
jgi:hypothetical protein